MEMAFQAVQIVLKIVSLVAVFGCTAGGSIGTAMRLTRLVCLDQPYAISVLEKCDLKLIRNRPSVVNLAVRYNRVERLYASVEMFVKSVRYRSLFPAQNVDVCAVLDGNMDGINPFTAFVVTALKMFAPHLLQNRRCPIEGVYDTMGFNLAENYTSSLLPPGNYFVAMRTYDEKNRTGIHFQLYASVRQAALFG